MINRGALKRKWHELRHLFLVISRKDIHRLVLAGVVGCLAALSETASIALIPLALKEISKGPIDLPTWLAGGFAIITLTLIFRIMDIKMRYRATLDIQVDIGERLLRANIIKRVAEGSALSESRFLAGLTHDIVNLGSVLTYFQTLIAQSILSLVILCCLLLVAGPASLLVSLVALTYYGSITYATARKVSGLGKITTAAQQDLLRVLRTQFGLAEALFAHRESQQFVGPFIKSTERLFSSQANANALISIPKVLIDQAVLIAAFLFVIYISSLNLSPERIGGIAALALLYLLSFNKLLPSLQQIYLSLSVMGQYIPSASTIVASLKTYEGFKSERRSVVHLDNSLVVEIRNLSLPPTMPKIYTESLANPGLTVHLVPGVIHLLQGSSGIGKTTLLKILAGFQRSGGGQILVNGKEVDPYLSESWARRVQYVAQSPFMLPGTVEENITLTALKGSRQSGDVHELSKMMEVVQLGDMDLMTQITDFNEGLSGGQQQRIAIARALYQRPQLLLLDEAFTGIDLSTRRLLLQGLAQHVVEHRICCLAISHDPLPGIETHVILLKRHP